jgi:hypothetical protein
MNLFDIDEKLSELGKIKNKFFTDYETYKRCFNDETIREDNDYVELLENIKTIELHKPYRNCITHEARLDFISNEIKKIEELKKIKNDYELQMYRNKDKYEKINFEFDNLYEIKLKIIEEEKIMDLLDNRPKCNICMFKQDNFVECDKCHSDICVKCYDQIININNNFKCPYCRNAPIL